MGLGTVIRAAAAAWAFTFALQPALADIVVGQAAPFSGPLAPTGTHLRAGAQLYFDAVNAAGGVHGHKLRLVSQDDGYKAAETVRLVQAIIKENQPIAFFGLVGTGNIEALLKDRVLDASAIPLVAFRSGSSSVAGSGNPWLFSTRATYADEIAKILQQYVPLGYKRVAVLYQDDAFGLDGLAAAKAIARENGGELVAKAAYEKNTTKVEGAVKAIAAASPGLVLMVSNTAASAEFVRQFKATGKSAQLVSLSTTDAQQVVDKIGSEAAHGLAITQVVPAPRSISVPLVKEVHEAWKRASPKDIAYNHTLIEGYLGAKVLVEAIRRAGPGAGPRKLRETLEGLRDYDAGGVVIGFSPNRHTGSRYVDIAIINREGALVR